MVIGIDRGGGIGCNLMSLGQLGEVAKAQELTILVDEGLLLFLGLHPHLPFHCQLSLSPALATVRSVGANFVIDSVMNSKYTCIRKKKNEQNNQSTQLLDQARCSCKSHLATISS